MADEGQSIEARVEWPNDLFEDPAISNLFVLSDDGQGLYLGLGHVPPFTGPAPTGAVTVIPNVCAAVYLTYQHTAELAELLANVVERKRKEIQERQGSQA